MSQEHAQVRKRFNEFPLQKIEAFEGKFHSLYNDYKKTLEENKLLIEEAKLSDSKIRMLEKAKENYKDQSLDLKQEIKQLKLQLQNRTASSSRVEGDESTTINGCILKENGNQSSEVIEVIEGK